MARGDWGRPRQIIEGPNGLRVQKADGRWVNASGTKAQYEAMVDSMDFIPASLLEHYGINGVGGQSYRYSELPGYVNTPGGPTVFADRLETQDVVNATTSSLTSTIPRPATAQATRTPVPKYQAERSAKIKEEAARRYGISNRASFKTKNI